MPRPTRDKSNTLPVLALLLAWLIPGAGHVYLGRTARGIVIFVTVAALFWSGAAMGGVMTVDYEAERWWFVADMLTGVHGAVGWYRQKQEYGKLAREMGREYRPGTIQESVLERKLADSGLALVAPTDTVARAYAGVAGLLNIMCIFDAVLLSLMGAYGEPPMEPIRKDET